MSAALFLGMSKFVDRIILVPHKFFGLPIFSSWIKPWHYLVITMVLNIERAFQRYQIYWFGSVALWLDMGRRRMRMRNIQESWIKLTPFSQIFLELSNNSNYISVDPTKRSFQLGLTHKIQATDLNGNFHHHPHLQNEFHIYTNNEFGNIMQISISKRDSTARDGWPRMPVPRDRILQHSNMAPEPPISPAISYKGAKMMEVVFFIKSCIVGPYHSYH